MIVENLKDIKEKTVQDILQNLTENLGFRIVIIFDLNNQNIVGIYDVVNLLVPDEQNRKTIFLKGKRMNLLSIIQNPNYQFNIKDEMNNIPISSLTFSENMFGFIGYGITSY